MNFSASDTKVDSSVQVVPYNVLPSIFLLFSFPLINILWTIYVIFHYASILFLHTFLLTVLVSSFRSCQQQLVGILVMIFCYLLHLNSLITFLVSKQESFKVWRSLIYSLIT